MNEIIIIIALILLNGLFAMSEIALISARKSSLSTDAKRGSKLAKLALKLTNEPDRFLSTVQIGITLIGILTGIYSGAKLSDDFAVLLQEWGVSTAYAPMIAQTVIVIAVTYLTLIFGELVPKRIGLSVAEKASKVIARPMYMLSWIATPFVWILAKSTSAMFNMLGLKDSESKVTEEEIKTIVQEGKEDGEVQEVEQDIVERVFLLGNLKVDDIMTQRNEITWLDVNMTKQEVMETLEQQLFDMYPVTDGKKDEVKGVISLKDLVLHLSTSDFNLEGIVRPAFYFPENMTVYKALEKMKEQRISRALICDEFGVCQGIITLRDILEALLGSVNDTHKEPDIIKRSAGEGWLVNGQCAFYDFLTYFEREELFESGNYNTVGGLILEVLEHIPQAGEQVRWYDFVFEVADMDGVRIDKVLVNLLE